MSNSLKGAILNPAVVRGLSAYEIAKNNGFEGTEEEWLDSLTRESADKAAVIVEGIISDKIEEAQATLDSLVNESGESAAAAQNSAENASASAKIAAESAAEASKVVSENIPSAEQAIENAKNGAVSDVDAAKQSAVSQIDAKVDDLLDLDQGTIAKLTKAVTTEGAKWEE